MSRNKAVRLRTRGKRRGKTLVVSTGICIMIAFAGIMMKNTSLSGSTATDAQKWEYIQDNQDLYPEALLDDLERNDEMLDFVAGYPAADHTAQGTITRKERRELCPLLLQWDSRWGYVDYGSSVIGVTGCGPTCLAMVIIGMTGNAVATPDYLANEAENKGYYINGQGTAWSFLVDEAQLFDLQVSQYSEASESELINALDKKSLIICSMKPGDFTDQGHFIVISDYTSEGFVVHDPFSRQNSNRLWDYETLSSQWKQLWFYSKM